MRAAPFILSLFVLAACGSPQVTKAPAPAPASINHPVVAPASEAKWEQLNPARGDQSPKAATLWGDRQGTEATGFLVQFVDGFSSPPHIHNISYRGVVIRGLVHNDDASAPEVWMPTGSFWTQPKGAAHITASKGIGVAYVEIDEGPYLVRPTDEAFPTEETPVRIETPNIHWQPSPIGGSDNQAQVAVLWGGDDGAKPRGRLFKLQPHAVGLLENRGRELRAVVIQGRLSYQNTDGPNTLLEPGSYFGSEGEAEHRFSCESEEACLLYVRSPGEMGAKTLPR